LYHKKDAMADVHNSSGDFPPMEINLNSCLPEELASWLCHHRFENNAIDAASFLLNCTAALPNAEEISAQLMGGANDDEQQEGNGALDTEDETKNVDADDPRSSQVKILRNIINSSALADFANEEEAMEIEVSCISPRGKFFITLYKHGIVLINPKKREEEQIPISPENVERIIFFRKPEDYKKADQMRSRGKSPLGHMVLICLSSNEAIDDSSNGINGITFRNKPLNQVCFQLPPYPSDSSNDSRQFTEEDWWNAFNFSIVSGRKIDIIRVQSKIDAPSYSTNSKENYLFKSAEGGETTTTEGMPFVGCYNNLNDGALFPLPEGLLFFKPPLFIPRSLLASISCGRGSGGSRYVDMIVQLESPSEHENSGIENGKKKKQSSKNTLEFTNIHREELSVLNDYIHNVLIPAMQIDAGEGEKNDEDSSEEVTAEVVESCDDDNDSDDKTASDYSGGNSRKRKRSSRAASKVAREATRVHFAKGEKSTNDLDDELEEDDDEEFQERAYDTEGSAEGEEDVFSDDENCDDDGVSSGDESVDEAVVGDSDDD